MSPLPSPTSSQTTSQLPAPPPPQLPSLHLPTANRRPFLDPVRNIFAKIWRVRTGHQRKHTPHTHRSVCKYSSIGRHFIASSVFYLDDNGPSFKLVRINLSRHHHSCFLVMRISQILSAQSFRWKADKLIFEKRGSGEEGSGSVAVVLPQLQL